MSYLSEIPQRNVVSLSPPVTKLKGNGVLLFYTVAAREASIHRGSVYRLYQSGNLTILAFHHVSAGHDAPPLSRLSEAKTKGRK
jgi:hypothetical protein